MKSFSKILLSALLVASFVANAQDEESSKPKLSISGSVDAYYRTNLNATNDTTATTLAPGTSFANKTGFALGMANVVLGLEGEKTGFVADLVFGPRGTDAVFNSTGSSSIVNQLYAYWNMSEKVTLTLGNFNTFLGYEVISPTGNFNYSTSYAFSYGPFSQTGVKADFTFGKLTAMLAIMNATDYTDFDDSNDYSFGAQLGFGGVYLNTILADDFYQVDLTGGWDLTDAIYLGVNATTAKDNFTGATLYLQNSFSDDLSLGLRGEYWTVSEDYAPTGEGLTANTFVAPGESVIDLTLSANYSVGDLTLIPEVRVDMWSQDVITPEAGKSNQGSLASFLLAAVYTF